VFGVPGQATKPDLTIFFELVLDLSRFNRLNVLPLHIDFRIQFACSSFCMIFYYPVFLEFYWLSLASFKLNAAGIEQKLKNFLSGNDFKKC